MVVLIYVCERKAFSFRPLRRVESEKESLYCLVQKEVLNLLPAEFRDLFWQFNRTMPLEVESECEPEAVVVLDPGHISEKFLEHWRGQNIPVFAIDQNKNVALVTGVTTHFEVLRQ